VHYVIKLCNRTLVKVNESRSSSEYQTCIWRFLFKKMIFYTTSTHTHSGPRQCSYCTIPYIMSLAGLIIFELNSVNKTRPPD
jgi:hypothetical protein